MTDPTPSVTCKFAGRTYSVPAGSAADVRGRLSDLTGIYNLKLLSSGRTLADSDTLAPNAKVMVIKCAAAAAPTIRLSVREIVTGRLAPKVEVDASITHDDLILKIVKALRLPPCDEATEVRVFLPHIAALMRPDLSLADYALPQTGRAVEIFAVPCPKAPKAEQCNALAQEAHELQKAAAQEAEKNVTPEEAALALQEIAAHAAAALSPRDAEAMFTQLHSLMPPSLKAAAEAEFRREVEEDEAAIDAGAALVLPPSIIEVSPTVAVTADGGGASSFELSPPSSPMTPASKRPPTSPPPIDRTPKTFDASVGMGRTRPRFLLGVEAALLDEQRNVQAEISKAASLVPTRIRTGLMPSHDDAPPRSQFSEQLPLQALLAEQVEAFEHAMVPPTKEEWSVYMELEESRLEERCADLISSLAPSLPSPISSKRAHRGDIAPSSSSARPSRPKPRTSFAARRRPSTDLSSSVSSISSAGGLSESAEAEDNEVEVDGMELDLTLAQECMEDVESDDESALCVLIDEGCENSSTAPALVSSTNSVSHEDAVEAKAEMPKKKVKGKACKSCGCRLPLTACASACKCGESFCANHMHAHNCVFDYKTAHEAKLREENPQVEGHKLERL